MVWLKITRSWIRNFVDFVFVLKINSWFIYFQHNKFHWVANLRESFNILDRCQPHSQLSFFVGFLILSISLPMKIVISQYKLGTVVVVVDGFNYTSYHCLSPPLLWVRIPPRPGLLDTQLCDQVCQWLSLDTPISSTTKTDSYDINWH